MARGPQRGGRVYRHTVDIGEFVIHGFAVGEDPWRGGEYSIWVTVHTGPEEPGTRGAVTHRKVGMGIANVTADGLRAAIKGAVLSVVESELDEWLSVQAEAG